MAKILCIIPARGGSKRVPRKNKLPLNGVPLITYTMRAAKESGVFAEILVSTDDEEIKALAAQEGIGVDHRPEAMCADTVTMVQVTAEYLERTNAAGRFDTVAVMLPTCPFRTAQDVRNAVELFNNKRGQAKFLMGVVGYEFPPQFCVTVEEDVATQREPEVWANTRSQDVKKYYHPNGSIYMGGIADFLAERTFFAPQTLAYLMPAERSLDIDYPYQYHIADFYMKHIQEGNGRI